MGYQKYGVSEIWVWEISGIISDISGIKYIGYQKYRVSEISDIRNIVYQKYKVSDSQSQVSSKVIYLLLTNPRYVFNFQSEDQSRSKHYCGNITKPNTANTELIIFGNTLPLIL